jgi:hypothetical protein
MTGLTETGKSRWPPVVMLSSVETCNFHIYIRGRANSGTTMKIPMIDILTELRNRLPIIRYARL